MTKKMRLLSAITAIVMVLTLLPASALATGDTVTVTIGNNSYDSGVWKGNLLNGVPVSVEFGDTVLDAVTKALTAAVNGTADYTSDMTSGYISSINGLNNDNTGYKYGWMGAVNGVFPSVGFGSIYVKNDDVINLQYLDYYDYEAMAEIGDWGSLNSGTDGFAFSAGRLSSITDEWGSILTLTVPQGTTAVKVTEVPNGIDADVEININGEPDVYELDDDIPITDGTVLRIFVGGSANIYEINVQALSKSNLDTLLENMSEKLAGSADIWEVIGMSAYRLYNPVTTNTTSEDARQEYINSAYAEISKTDATDTDFAKAIIALQSIGVDPGALYPINSNNPIDIFNRLMNMRDTDMSSMEVTESAPSVLSAFRQNPSLDFSSQEKKIIDFLLSAQLANGSWASSSVAIIGADVDTPAMIITALAPYYSSNASVKNAIDRAFDWIKEKQDPLTGAFGTPWPGSTEPSYNMNSTAMVIISMCAMGYDPDGTDIFSRSALDGLLSFVNADMDNFAPWGDWEGQGFRALVAAAQYYKINGAIDIYDFSGVDVQPGRATGDGKPVEPGQPGSDTNISVSFTLNGLGGATWISKRSMTIQSDATVYHLFTTVLNNLSGFSYDYANNGYIRSITHPSHGKLEEFQNGNNSGWVYSINGDLPTIGMTSKSLNNGDNVIWYYTGDYTKEPGASAFGDSQPNKGQNSKGNADTPKIVSTEIVEIKAKSDDNNRTTAGADTDSIMNALSNAVKSVEEAIKGGDTNVAAEIKITVVPEDSEKTVTAVDFNIPAELIEAISKEENIILTIECPIGSISLNSDTLSGLALEVGDDKDTAVTITAELVDTDSGLNAKQREIVGNNPVISLKVLVGGTQITEFDDTVTVTLPFTPPDAMSTDDYDLLTVYYLDDMGNTQEMKGSYNPETGMLTFTTTHFSIFFISEWISPFNDASLSDWFFRAARFTYSNGLIRGTTPTTFAPNVTMTHAMLITILAREEGIDTDNGETWYTSAMEWGVTAGITDGANPSEGIARERFAVILYHYAEYKGLDMTSTTNLSAFSDLSEISEGALEAITWAVASGIVNGRSPTSLAPKETLIRAEAATMLQRFIDNFLRG